MLKLDELSGEVAGLEALRSSLAMLERMRKLEEESDAWLRLQQLAELLEAPECCGPLKAAVCASVDELVRELRASFTDDVAAAAKDLGWPKPIDIPASLLHSTDGMLAEWIRPQTPGDAPKKPSHQQRLEHFCRVLARLTSLQLIALKTQQPATDAGGSVLDAPAPSPAHRDAAPQGGGASRSGGFFLDAWGVECLLSALDLRFRFHFRSARKTNRLDKPEWFLSYQLSRLKEHVFFLDTIVQPCVRLCGSGTLARYDAVLHVTAGLVRQICAKIAADVPLLLQQDAVMMTTIREAILFDNSLAALLQSSDRATPHELHAVLSPGEAGRMLSCLQGMMSDKRVLQLWLNLEAQSRLSQVCVCVCVCVGARAAVECVLLQNVFSYRWRRF